MREVEEGGGGKGNPQRKRWLAGCWWELAPNFDDRALVSLGVCVSINPGWCRQPVGHYSVPSFRFPSFLLLHVSPARIYPEDGMLRADLFTLKRGSSKSFRSRACPSPGMIFFCATRQSPLSLLACFFMPIRVVFEKSVVQKENRLECVSPRGDHQQRAHPSIHPSILRYLEARESTLLLLPQPRVNHWLRIPNLRLPEDLPFVPIVGGIPKKIRRRLRPKAPPSPAAAAADAL